MSSGNKRVFIGNMSWKTRWYELKDHMKQIGPVAYADVFTDSNGRSRGCGIVEYENPEDAQKAIAQLTDTELDGRKIFVREDKEEGKPRAERTTKPREKREEAVNTNPKKVFVGNLSFNFSVEQLKDEFKSCGTIVNAEIPTDRNGRSRGWATIEFATDADAQNAINQINGKTVGGRPLRVYLDKN